MAAALMYTSFVYHAILQTGITSKHVQSNIGIQVQAAEGNAPPLVLIASRFGGHPFCGFQRIALYNLYSFIV